MAVRKIDAAKFDPANIKIADEAATARRQQRGGGTGAGKPKSFPDSKIIEALDKVAFADLSLKAACAVVGIPYDATLQRIWASDELTRLDTRARQHFVKARARRMNELVDHEEDVGRARLKCDNIKWEAARIMPREYGDRTVLVGDNENPIHARVTLLDPTKLAAMSVADLKKTLEVLENDE